MLPRLLQEIPLSSRVDQSYPVKRELRESHPEQENLANKSEDSFTDPLVSEYEVWLPRYRCGIRSSQHCLTTKHFLAETQLQSEFLRLSSDKGPGCPNVYVWECVSAVILTERKSLEFFGLILRQFTWCFPLHLTNYLVGSSKSKVKKKIKKVMCWVLYSVITEEGNKTKHQLVTQWYWTMKNQVKFIIWGHIRMEEELDYCVIFDLFEVYKSFPKL